MNQRTIIALLMTVLLAVGCARSYDEPEDVPEVTEDIVLTIFYAKNSSLSLVTLHDFIRPFEAKYPHVRVQVEEHDEIPRKPDGNIDLARMSGFDVFVLSGMSAYLYENGIITDLNQLSTPNWDPLVEHLAEASGYVRGDRVFLPLMFTYTQMLYEPRLFEEAGVQPPTHDWTYDDMELMARQLRSAGQRAEFVHLRLLEPMSRAYGVEYPEVGDSYQFDTPAHRQVLQKLREWIEEGMIPYPLSQIRPSWSGPDALALSNLSAGTRSVPGYQQIPYPKGPAGRKPPWA